MEWIDTLMLEPAPKRKVTHLRIYREPMQVRVAQGTTLLCANIVSYQETTEALELLRGFRATGRRLVLCDTSRISAGRQLGQAIVAGGHASVLVSCGMAGREVAIGARDSGLDLANVVVCRDSRAACELMAAQLMPGDTVLLLGVDSETSERLVELLDGRSNLQFSTAA
jgi:UDP-N-acetylmuramyl pentapeptide synthase